MGCDPRRDFNAFGLLRFRNASGPECHAGLGCEFGIEYRWVSFILWTCERHLYPKNRRGKCNYRYRREFNRYGHIFLCGHRLRYGFDGKSAL
jgi:hypothetical protein